MRTVLTGGTIIDGRGREEEGSVMIRGSAIEDVVWGKALPPLSPGDLMVDVSGLTVAPGLIDMHSHDDVAATVPEIYEGKIRQGVTTSLISMDGIGYAPLPAHLRDAVVSYWRAVDGDPGPLWGTDIDAYVKALTGQLGLNVAIGVPHANIRLATIGFGFRLMTPTELNQAAAAVQQSLSAGAYGLTTGLSYTPAASSNWEELLAMCTPLQACQRPYISHLRSYGAQMFDAVDEALSLGRDLDIPVHLSHLHMSHQTLFGRGAELLEHLLEARRSGIRVTWDVYPYSAGSSILHSYLPRWVNEGGPEEALRRLGDESCVERLETDPGVTQFDWNRVIIAFTPSGKYVGQSVAEIARIERTSWGRTMAKMLREEELGIGCIVHQTEEADDIILSEAEFAMVGSDGIPFGQRPHPRYCGAFGAFFRRHVTERRTMTVQTAISRMSTLTAEVVGLTGRGVVARGGSADLMVFDPKTFRDRSTYEDPRQHAVGVHHVLVNGQFVLRDGVFFPACRVGQVLRIS